MDRRATAHAAGPEAASTVAAARAYGRSQICRSVSLQDGFAMTPPDTPWREAPRRQEKPMTALHGRARECVSCIAVIMLSVASLRADELIMPHHQVIERPVVLRE